MVIFQCEFLILNRTAQDSEADCLQDTAYKVDYDDVMIKIVDFRVIMMLYITVAGMESLIFSSKREEILRCVGMDPLSEKSRSVFRKINQCLWHIWEGGLFQSLVSSREAASTVGARASLFFISFHNSDQYFIYKSK